MALGFAAWSAIRFGGLEDAIQYLRGHEIVAVSTVISLGTQPNGTHCPVKIRLRNLSDKPIRVVGASTSCSCVATSNPPVLIGARQSAVLDATLAIEGEPSSKVEQTIDYYTEALRTPRIRISLEGVVSPGT